MEIPNGNSATQTTPDTSSAGSDDYTPASYESHSGCYQREQLKNISGQGHRKSVEAPMRQSTGGLFPGELQRAHAQTQNIPGRGHLQETGSKAKIQKREAEGGLPRETEINPEWAGRGPGAACWNLIRAVGLTQWQQVPRPLAGNRCLLPRSSQEFSTSRFMP